MTEEQEIIERTELVRVAKTWSGVRYVDHAESREGADCAGFMKGILVEAKLVDAVEIPYYNPDQWMHRGFEDRTYLDIVLSLYDEITEEKLQPGDLVLYKLVSSWTHGAIVITWPHFVLHCIKTRGVCGSHGSREGFLRNRARRFFRLKRWLVLVSEGQDAR